MKIRKGFVSNSSSSSFLIYGTYFYKEDLPEQLLKKIYDNIREEYPEVRTEEEAEEWYYDDPLGYVQELFPGLEVDTPYYSDTFYVGSSWANVGDDETGAQFKASVEEKIHKILPKAKCATHQEAWHD